MPQLQALIQFMDLKYLFIHDLLLDLNEVGNVIIGLKCLLQYVFNNQISEIDLAVFECDDSFFERLVDIEILFLYQVACFQVLVDLESLVFYFCVHNVYHFEDE